MYSVMYRHYPPLHVLVLFLLRLMLSSKLVHIHVVLIIMVILLAAAAFGRKLVYKVELDKVGSF